MRAHAHTPTYYASLRLAPLRFMKRGGVSRERKRRKTDREAEGSEAKRSGGERREAERSGGKRRESGGKRRDKPPGGGDKAAVGGAFRPRFSQECDSKVELCLRVRSRTVERLPKSVAGRLQADFWRSVFTRKKQPRMGQYKADKHKSVKIHPWASKL